MALCSRLRRGPILLAALAVLCLCLAASPAGAFDLFATHEVTAQFATPAGQPMAHAPVRVFAPGDPTTPALTGRTDANGKFTFATDRDGFWSAEAVSKGEVARVMIRVGNPAAQPGRVSPVLAIGVLFGLLVMALGYRLIRARARRPRA